MTVTDSYAVSADTLASIINTEFGAEGVVVRHDKLHESLGSDGVVVGIAPIEDLVNPRSNATQESIIEIRFYNQWTKEIKPTTVIDPRIITNYAERFRRALHSSFLTSPHTQALWFFDLTRITYPDDPTGNKSRFVATIRAYGNNSALVESTG